MKIRKGKLVNIVRGGVAKTALLFIYNKITAALTIVIITRILGAELYGVFSIAVSLMILLSLPLTAGLPQFVVRETSRYWRDGNREKIQGLLIFVVIFSLAFSLFVASIILLTPVGELIIPTASENKARETTIVILLAMPFVALSGLRSSILRGIGGHFWAQFPELAARPTIYLIAISIYFYSLGSNTTAQAVALIYLFAAVSAFIIGIVIFRRLYKPTKMTEKINFSDFRRSYISISLFSSVILFLGEFLTIIVGSLSTNEDAGIFRAMLLLSMLPASGSRIINLALSAEVAGWLKDDKKALVQQKLQRTSGLLTLLLLAIVGVTILTDAEFLTMILGDTFSRGYSVLLILLTGHCISASIGSVALVANMGGYERKTVWPALLALLICISLATILVPTYGATGAAVAWSAATISWNTVLLRICTKKIGVNPSLLFGLLWKKKT